MRRAMRRSFARIARRTRTAWTKRHAARSLPEPDADPAVIARALEFQTHDGPVAEPDPAIDALCGDALSHHAGAEAVTAAAARWFLATGRPEQAVLACENAFSHNAAFIGKSHAVQTAWGEALLALDRAGEAVWRLKAACAAPGATVDDWARLARALCRCGRYGEALDAGQRASRRPWVRPDAADDALVTMATAHYCLGQMAEAEGILLELLARTPHHAEARRLIRKVWGFMGKGIQHDS